MTIHALPQADFSSPFKGEVGWGMGFHCAPSKPIPTPALPLKGRVRTVTRTLVISFKRAVSFPAAAACRR
ncbi:MAG: hypothetical protein EPO06_05830 [Burkholderiaceae bacterium]|nr:MAG: hypothetical protein EPO06_05830 [Burkholderiaceae bacterium]